MNYIKDIGKFNRIKALASKGDETAKNFLFDFMNMDDEKANAYLSQFDEKPNQEVESQDEWKKVVQALIQDDNEAIDGYDKAIKYVANADIPELVKTAYTERLNHIKNEEIEHINELKEIV